MNENQIRGIRKMAEAFQLPPADSQPAAGAMLLEALKETLECLKGWVEIADKEDLREYDTEAFVKNVNIPYSDDLTLYKAPGCPECNNTGYKGCMAIHELLTGTDPMKRLIQMKATIEEIRKQALSDGMTTLKQDGIEKVFAGSTDLMEVRKVCMR